MASESNRGAQSRVYIALAGVQSGMLGGVFRLAWLAILSRLQGRTLWSIPNLLASTFYGEAALRRGFRWTTVTGMALHLTMTAAAGIIFAMTVCGVASRGRVMLLGVAAGLAWH